MNIIQAEQEYLLRSIIKNEKWIFAPGEEVFFKVLNEIAENTDLEYKEHINNLIIRLKDFEYQYVKDLVNKLIDSPEEE